MYRWRYVRKNGRSTLKISSKRRKPVFLSKSSYHTLFLDVWLCQTKKNSSITRPKKNPIRNTYGMEGRGGGGGVGGVGEEGEWWWGGGTNEGGGRGPFVSFLCIGGINNAPISSHFLPFPAISSHFLPFPPISSHSIPSHSLPFPPMGEGKGGHGESELRIGRKIRFRDLAMQHTAPDTLDTQVYRIRL